MLFRLKEKKGWLIQEFYVIKFWGTLLIFLDIQLVARYVFFYVFLWNFMFQLQFTFNIVLLPNAFNFFPQSPIPISSDWLPSVRSLYLWVSFNFIYSVCKFYIIQIIWYLSFSQWLISLSIIPSRSIHSVANDKISFFMINSYFIVNM